jgi:hypothetical protein
MDFGQQPRVQWPRAALVAILLGASTPAMAGQVQLRIINVTEPEGGRDTALRVDSHASFFLNSEAGTLKSSGFWIAQRVIGAERRTRYTHTFEDLEAAADGYFSVRSYQCDEGLFGAEFLATNICGNYRFGANELDEGGYGDDVILGPPRSLKGYRVEDFDWDGQRLALTIGPDATKGDPGAAGPRFRITFAP